MFYRVVVNCMLKSFFMKTASMGEINGKNTANETSIDGEISCARESMEI